MQQQIVSGQRTQDPIRTFVQGKAKHSLRKAASLVSGSFCPKTLNTQTTLVHNGEVKACRKEVGEEKSNYLEREVARREDTAWPSTVMQQIPGYPDEAGRLISRLEEAQVYCGQCGGSRRLCWSGRAVITVITVRAKTTLKKKSDTDVCMCVSHCLVWGPDSSHSTR